MSKFQIAAVQMFTTEDGKQFASVEEAQAHQFMLENMAEFSAIADNHCNALKLADRARSLRFNAIVEFLGWQKSWDGVDVERTVFDSEPKPRAKKGEAAAGEGETATAEVAQEAADDMFGAE